jgi:hypothetical protein
VAREDQATAAPTTGLGFSPKFFATPVAALARFRTRRLLNIKGLVIRCLPAINPSRI